MTPILKILAGGIHGKIFNLRVCVCVCVFWSSHCMQGHCLAVQQAVLTAWGMHRGQQGFLAHKEDSCTNTHDT